MGNSPHIVCSICKNQQQKIKRCLKCSTDVCQKCYDFPILDSDKQFTLNKAKYQTVCVNCFKSTVSLDFSKTYQIIGDQNEKQIILIHGAGSCRKMFLPHARKWKQLGYRCILIDLPGHGGRFQQDLNAQNCLKAIKQATNLCKTKNYSIIGASLGAYVLMDCLGIQQNLCTKAIIMMAGQNVGVGRSIPASIGLWVMGKAINLFSQAGVAENFLKAASGNPNLDAQLIKELSQGGTYFKHADGNIKLLKQSNPSQALQKAKNVKCLFINGSKDHRDSQQIWLNSAGEGSKLILYEEADHFYSHDKRFFDRLIKDVHEFIKNG